MLCLPFFFFAFGFFPEQKLGLIGAQVQLVICLEKGPKSINQLNQFLFSFFF